MEVKIQASWKKHLEGEFEQQYFRELTKFVKEEYKTGVVYPAPKNIFRAFDLCPFDQVKVVILGQDPYHGAGQATGLAFAVDAGVANPPSLQNIVKEMRSDLGVEGGTISFDTLAAQGVLLLNATLTVRASAAGSHQGQGWEQFTDAVIKALSEGREGLVFMLWGNYARAKGAHIDRTKHLVLESAHPSPLSAYNGFFGCKHFSKANKYLAAHGSAPLVWLR